MASKLFRQVEAQNRDADRLRGWTREKCPTCGVYYKIKTEYGAASVPNVVQSTRTCKHSGYREDVK